MTNTDKRRGSIRDTITKAFELAIGFTPHYRRLEVENRRNVDLAESTRNAYGLLENRVAELVKTLNELTEQAKIHKRDREDLNAAFDVLRELMDSCSVAYESGDMKDVVAHCATAGRVLSRIEAHRSEDKRRAKREKAAKS